MVRRGRGEVRLFHRESFSPPSLGNQSRHAIAVSISSRSRSQSLPNRNIDAMNIRRQNMAIALFAWAVVSYLSSYTRVIAQNDDDYRRGEITLRLASGSAKAKRLEFERYRLWHRVQSKFGFPFQTHYSRTELLFPAGKSDRLYLVLMAPWWPSWSASGTDELFCFQLDNYKVILVYKVSLTLRVSSSNEIRPFKNLLDYMPREYWAIRGRISNVVQNDLAMERNYVSYEYDPIESTLDVFLLSDLSDLKKRVPDVAQREAYFILEDPLTHSKFKENSEEFYRKYGFPVARGELSYIIGATGR
jgi:hypothetical protein